MSFRNDQGVPWIDRIGVKDAHERPVFKNKRIGIASAYPAKITVLM
jgi:hypothetical protein